MKRKYDEASVIRTLAKNPDVHVNCVSMTVEVARNSTRVGNGSWGKIDYLQHCGYVVVFTDKGNSNIIFEDDTPKRKTKKDKLDLKNQVNKVFKMKK